VSASTQLRILWEHLYERHDTILRFWFIVVSNYNNHFPEMMRSYVFLGPKLAPSLRYLCFDELGESYRELLNMGIDSDTTSSLQLVIIARKLLGTHRSSAVAALLWFATLFIVPMFRFFPDPTSGSSKVRSLCLLCIHLTCRF
jgi:hypothetical protein